MGRVESARYKGCDIVRRKEPVEFAILVLYTFGQIQQIAPRGPLAVRSVWALEKTLLVHSPGSVNWNKAEWLGLSRNQSQPINKVLHKHRR